ncbi:MAG: hypothetical protein WAK82_04975 [Streptosporangiaceae bacterium]
MTPLIAVLGIVGAMLILVGLVGGGFTFSGKFMPQVGMPKVGNWVRLPCFSVGAVLVLIAVGLGVVYSPVPASASDSSDSPRPSASASASVTPSTSSSPSPTDASNQIATGTIVAPQGDTALYVFDQPSLSSSHVAEIADGATIGILCTEEGDVVTNPDSGQSSSLWDGTSEGFVPDVYVNTGTNQPTMGSC